MTDRSAAKPCCAPGPVVDSEPVAAPTRSATSVSREWVDLTGGWFRMGADDGPHPEDGEGPTREVWVDPFRLAPVTVTNAEFGAFANETGYRTLAERLGSSFVFHLLLNGDARRFPAVRVTPWWRSVEGASWKCPAGPGSDVNEIPDHPVVHIALPDALTYCHWSGTRLPTEAEWEYAARGGFSGSPFPWGDFLEMDDTHRCNIWQGNFPNENTADDGYVGTAPARSYAPNAFGLFNMTGNVWEWTADRFTRLHSARPIRNPKGPLNGAEQVAKGGSYLCHASYCSRYRTSSRQALNPSTTTGNVGFRVAARDIRQSPEALP